MRAGLSYLEAPEAGAFARRGPRDRIIPGRVRLRTPGCWPVTGAIESRAADRRAIVSETFLSPVAEQQGRGSGRAGGDSLEQMPREGDF